MLFVKTSQRSSFEEARGIHPRTATALTANRFPHIASCDASSHREL